MKEIKIITSNRCNFMCPYCKYRCSPLKKGIMDVKNFEYSVKYNIQKGYNQRLTIDGGEVFLYTGMLFKYLKAVKNIEIIKSAATNAFWGRMDPYLYTLIDLNKIGLQELIIEYDYFHSSFVDESTIYEAINKCQIAGLKVGLRSMITTNDISSTEDRYTYNFVKKIKEKFQGISVIFEIVGENLSREYWGKRQIQKNCIMVKY